MQKIAALLVLFAGLPFPGWGADETKPRKFRLMFHDIQPVIATLAEELRPGSRFESVSKIAVANRRMNAESPPVFKATCVLDLRGRDPVVLERTLEETDTDAADLDLFLELSGVDEERIVARKGAFDAKEVELPTELAFLADRFPDLRLTELKRDFTTKQTEVKGYVVSAFQFQNVMDSVKEAGVDLTIVRFASDELGAYFTFSYNAAPPEKEEP